MAPMKRAGPVDDEDDDGSAGSDVIGVDSAQSNLRRDSVRVASGFRATIY